MPASLLKPGSPTMRWSWSISSNGLEIVYRWLTVRLPTQILYSQLSGIATYGGQRKLYKHLKSMHEERQCWHYQLEAAHQKRIPVVLQLQLSCLTLRREPSCQWSWKKSNRGRRTNETFANKQSFPQEPPATTAKGSVNWGLEFWIIWGLTNKLDGRHHPRCIGHPHQIGICNNLTRINLHSINTTNPLPCMNEAWTSSVA